LKKYIKNTPIKGVTSAR